MPIEYDDLGLRIIGHNVKGLKFYDDERVLRAEVYLQDDDTLNIGGGIGGGVTVIEGGAAVGGMPVSVDLSSNAEGVSSNAARSDHHHMLNQNIAPVWTGKHTFTVGLGGDTILLYDSGGDPVAEYAATSAGLTAALAAATSGDTVLLPSITISVSAALTVGTGVVLAGMGPGSYLSASGFSGTAITLAASARACDFRLAFVSNGTTAVGIDCTAASTVVSGVESTVSGGSSSNTAILTGEEVTDGPGTLTAFGTSGGVTHTDGKRWSCVNAAGAWRGAGFRINSGLSLSTGVLSVTMVYESASVAPTGQKLMASNSSANSGVSPDTTPTLTANTSGTGYPGVGVPVTFTGTSTAFSADGYFCITTGYAATGTYTARITEIVWTVGVTDTVLWEESHSDPTTAPLIQSCIATATGTGADGVKVSSGQAFVIQTKASGATYDLEVSTYATAYVSGTEYVNGAWTGTIVQEWGDRAAFDVDSYATRHASDINGSALQRHLPLPGAAGGLARSDGTDWQRVSELALADLASYARGSIIRGGAADWEAYVAKTLGQILVGNGTDVASVAVSGDATLAANGALSVGKVLDGSHVADVANDQATPGIPVVFAIAVAGGAAANEDITIVGKHRVIDVWCLHTGGAGEASDTIQVFNGANAITDAMDWSGADATVVRAATFDDAYTAIASGGTLRATTTDNDAGADVGAGIVYVLAIPVA